VFVGVYGLGLSGGAEMIAFGNRLTPLEKESLLEQRDVSVVLDGGALEVREFVVPGDGGRVVWRWYRVGDRSYVSEWQVKAAEALAFLSGGDASDRVLMLSSPSQPDVASARARLHSFAQAHAHCLRGGFELDACAP
jgi:EpsI family protein